MKTGEVTGVSPSGREKKHTFFDELPVPFHVLASFEMKILDALDAWIGCIPMCIVEGCLDKI